MTVFGTVVPAVFLVIAWRSFLVVVAKERIVGARLGRGTADVPPMDSLAACSPTIGHSTGEDSALSLGAGWHRKPAMGGRFRARDTRDTGGRMGEGS